MNRFQLAIKAAVQLGLQKTALYARYQLGLKSGWIKLLTPSKQPSPKAEWLKPSDAFPLSIPDSTRLDDLSESLLAEANTILSGNFHRFGAKETTPINLSPPPPLTHWTQTNDNPGSGEDIKFTWEPARFGWVFPLGRAYALRQDDKYAAAFWQQAETFWAANPSNLGPNWASGQEVALRILAFSFALQVFDNAPSTNPERRQRLLASITNTPNVSPPPSCMPAPKTIITSSPKPSDFTLQAASCRTTRKLPAGGNWAGAGSPRRSSTRLTPMAPTSSSQSTTTV